MAGPIIVNKCQGRQKSQQASDCIHTVYTSSNNPHLSRARVSERLPRIPQPLSSGAAQPSGRKKDGGALEGRKGAPGGGRLIKGHTGAVGALMGGAVLITLSTDSTFLYSGSSCTAPYGRDETTVPGHRDGCGGQDHMIELTQRFRWRWGTKAKQ